MTHFLTPTGKLNTLLFGREIEKLCTNWLSILILTVLLGYYFHAYSGRSVSGIIYQTSNNFTIQYTSLRKYCIQVSKANMLLFEEAYFQ